MLSRNEIVMTANKDRKDATRARMARTGESYSTALRAISQGDNRPSKSAILRLGYYMDGLNAPVLWDRDTQIGQDRPALCWISGTPVKERRTLAAWLAQQASADGESVMVITPGPYEEHYADNVGAHVVPFHLGLELPSPLSSKWGTDDTPSLLIADVAIPPGWETGPAFADVAAWVAACVRTSQSRRIGVVVVAPEEQALPVTAAELVSAIHDKASIHVVMGPGAEAGHYYGATVGTGRVSTTEGVPTMFKLPIRREPVLYNPSNINVDTALPADIVTGSGRVISADELDEAASRDMRYGAGPRPEMPPQGETT